MTATGKSGAAQVLPHLIGDVSTQRIVIEDGAFFKGAIDIKEKDTKSESRKLSDFGYKCEQRRQLEC